MVNANFNTLLDPKDIKVITKFRNNAKVTKSSRGWTTTIRFGQPKIVDEKGKKYQHDYPQTILHEIQKRPNLPPPPYDVPGKVVPWQLWTYSWSYEEEVKLLSTEELLELNIEKNTYWEAEYENYKDFKNEEIPLVYALKDVLVQYLEYDQEEEAY